MHSELRAQLAFRFTGLRSQEQSSLADPRALRPALTARHRNLAALRYDYPIVLPFEPAAGDFALTLTAMVDRALGEKAEPSVCKAALRVEREIRTLLAQGASRTLFGLWELAVNRLVVRGDETLPAVVAAVRKALGPDGEVVDCEAALPRAFVLQAWKTVQKGKAERFHEEARRLIVRLGEILLADDARSGAARSPERLRESVGTVHRDVFDFEAMSGLLGRGAPKRPLTEARRRRIKLLIVALESQRFFLDESGYTFVFDRCAPALRAFRARQVRLRSLARNLAMARLEVDGEYDESRHDALFQQIRQAPLSAEELARFPDYLVCLRDGDLDAQGRGELTEALCCGMPVKVLVQSDDIVEEAIVGEGLAAVGARADAVAGEAIGLGTAFVLQASASSLPRLAERVHEALAYPGPALVSVFSGASGDSCCLPPYLNAAAATESRAFPTFVYDPRKRLGEGAFSLDGNPQPEADWPLHGFDYEDADLQRVAEDLAFTVVDFAAADERFSTHFLDSRAGNVKAASVTEWLEATRYDASASPMVPMVDQAGTLHRLIIDETVVALAERVLARWRRLQRLASVGVPVKAEAALPDEVPVAQAVTADPVPAVAPTPPEAKAPASDDAYIETPRCTTCNECTQINNRMFAYDANKQAYVADVGAGTYRQLVEAAESCQVSIIHPGKPKNADEDGLEELLERAQPFI